MGPYYLAVQVYGLRRGCQSSFASPFAALDTDIGVGGHLDIRLVNHHSGLMASPGRHSRLTRHRKG